MTLAGKLGRTGVIGRFKPLHNGGAVLLEELCRKAEHVVIGIGSANIYGIRNPFTAEESKGMTDAYLSPRFSNYEFVLVDQFGHLPEYSDGKRWTQEVLKLYGDLDAFVSGNEYVRELLAPHYNVIESYLIVPPEKRIHLSATEVRIEMARGESWRAMVPEEAEKYMEGNNLVERFRREFGLKTLASLAEGYHSPLGIIEEKAAVTRCAQ